MEADSPLFVAFAIIGFVATVVTLVWVMWIIAGAIFRKPKLRLEFGQAQGKHGPILTCDFYNDPLSGGIFSLLNIKKQNIDEFWVLASVNDGRGKRVCELAPALHDKDGKHSDHHPLPTSVSSVHWPIVSFDDVGPVLIDNQNALIYLLPDTYELRFFLHADEVDVRVISHRFLAGADENVLQWVGRPHRIRTALPYRILRHLRGGRRLSTPC